MRECTGEMCLSTTYIWEQHGGPQRWEEEEGAITLMEGRRCGVPGGGGGLSSWEGTPHMWGRSR